MTDETTGYLSEKWSNLKDDGTTASNTANDGVDTDFHSLPLGRCLSDVCRVRGSYCKGAIGMPWPGGKTDASRS